MVRLMLLSAVRPPLPLLLQILVPLIAAQPTNVTSTCLSPVRPFFGAHGKWTEAAPGALDLYYHSVVNYEPDTCGMLERVRNRHGRKPVMIVSTATGLAHPTERLRRALAEHIRVFWPPFYNGLPKRYKTLR